MNPRQRIPPARRVGSITIGITPSGERDALVLRLSRKPEFLNAAMQARAGNVQHLGGQRLVAPSRSQSLFDQATFEAFEHRVERKLLLGLRRRQVRAAQMPLDVRGQVLGANHLGGCPLMGEVDDPDQLAEISRPIILHQGLDCFGTKTEPPNPGSSVGPIKEVLSQNGKLLQALLKRQEADDQCRKGVEQVGPETVFPQSVLWITPCQGKYADLGGVGKRQGFGEAGLKISREFQDVSQDQTTMVDLETSRTFRSSPGTPKEFPIDYLGREGRTVDHHEGSIRSPSPRMDRPGHLTFARAGRPDDQDRHLRHGGSLDLIDQSSMSRPKPDQRIRSQSLLKGFSKFPELRPESSPGRFGSEGRLVHGPDQTKNEEDSSVSVMVGPKFETSPVPRSIETLNPSNRRDSDSVHRLDRGMKAIEHFRVMGGLDRRFVVASQDRRGGDSGQFLPRGIHVEKAPGRPEQEDRFSGEL